MSVPGVLPQQSESAVMDSPIQQSINRLIDETINALPDPKQLTSEERRGIIGRYTTVLEGNFIYWMTATLIATKAEEAKPILLENLFEECKDSHPHMLRKFAIEAHAFPTAEDGLAVHEDLTNMRLFLGKLSGVQSLAAMAFFEGFIQKFMPFLANLAAAEGSKEMEYTDVHGVCDIAHTDGLFRALATEMVNDPPAPGTDLLQGVNYLRALLNRIVHYRSELVTA